MRIRRVIIPYVLVFSLLIGITVAGNQTVQTIAGDNILQNRRIIIIDAGHGGIDGGAVSCTGVFESTINLEIAIRLNDLFHLLGYRTIMIRSSDCSVHTSGNTIAEKKISDLKERVRIVNETEDALFISIHQNTFSQSKYSGAQVFYANTAGSRELAESLQSRFCKSINPGSNRKAKQSSGVYLMEHINTTGILVECGFLSNPGEEALLRSQDYQKQICGVIAATVASQIPNT